MSKYNQEHERRGRDFYPTPQKATLALKYHLSPPNHRDDHQPYKFIEPCCGDGRLINHLSPEFECVYASDIEPMAEAMSNPIPYQKPIVLHKKNLFEIDWSKFNNAMNFDMFITNPPWINDSNSQYQLNRIINYLSKFKPTWLLMNGSYAFNKKSAECMKICTNIVPVGRVKWIEDSAHSGKEDCAWFCFDQTLQHLTPEPMAFFHPREV